MMDEEREFPSCESAKGEGNVCPFCGSAVEEAAVRIGPNKHREVQVRRLGGRLLFDKERKETFLQWFALTANICFAAEQAGVTRQTVAKHRLSDPDFAAAYREALALSVPDLMARLVAHAQGKPVLDPSGELAPPDEDAFDPQLALQILREQQKMLEASKSGGPLKAGRTPRVATNAEVAEALTKALTAYRARMVAEGCLTDGDGSDLQGDGAAASPLHLPMASLPSRAGEDE